ncbi:MAG TPA: adenylate/guanylate cyclase domain-containing protein [Thermoplasmata archaeon]|nr:adenylate/guanylate cyclase domain-containing protein [Thermoplasmata archaeon]
MATGRRRLAAIMFTDIVGYSARVQADEKGALADLARHNDLLRPIFERFGGREIKTVGDAFLVEFPSALDAVHGAQQIQIALGDYNRSVESPRRIQIRIGIHVGDVVESNDDVLGDAVNIASRIQSLAEPGGICLTQQVVDQVQNKIEAPLVSLGPTALKNIRLPVAVYRLVPPRVGAGEPTLDGRSGGHHLAVLPLANISPDPSDGYFADGLTEELIAVLSHVRGLNVIARTSVAPYKTAPKSIAQVGSELGVDTVLEGSVRKAGNRIRITLQLIDVATQGHVWANSYNREVDDVFAVQTDIAERTAEVLRLQLAPSELSEARRRPTANPAAYDLYLRGLVAARLSHGKGIDEALAAFEKATQLDPTFAEAYAAWANLYVGAAGDFFPFRSIMPRARDLAGKALALDADSSDAHSALANIALQFDHDWNAAEAEFRRALEINPSNVPALRFYGLLLECLGRFDEAMELYRRALRLDPGGESEGALSWIELEAGRVDEAIARAEHIHQDHPDALRQHLHLGMFYVQAGRRAEAAREAATPLGNADDDERFDHALLNALVGRPEAARQVASAVERGEAGSYTSAAHLAMLYASLGEREKALDLLEKDDREGDQVLWLFFRGPFFDSIRDDPRFVALLRKYRLPTELPRRLRPPNS